MRRAVENGRESELGVLGERSKGAGGELSRGEALRQKYSGLSSAERSARISELAEANAGRRLAELEANAQTYNPNTHFFSRHGAHTTLAEQQVRATTGLTPDGFAGNPMHSSRFLTNLDQLHAIERANTIHYQTGRPVINTSLETIIGEGYLRGGVDYVQTNKVTVVYRNGLPYTAYPKLR